MRLCRVAISALRSDVISGRNVQVCPCFSFVALRLYPFSPSICQPVRVQLVSSLTRARGLMGLYARMSEGLPVLLMMYDNVLTVCVACSDDVDLADDSDDDDSDDENDDSDDENEKKQTQPQASDFQVADVEDSQLDHRILSLRIDAILCDRDMPDTDVVIAQDSAASLCKADYSKAHVLELKPDSKVFELAAPGDYLTFFCNMDGTVRCAFSVLVCLLMTLLQGNRIVSCRIHVEFCVRDD